MWPFRYIGRQQKILTIYRCFAQEPRKALHPMEISRETGIPVTSVKDCLENAPELFVRIPTRKDGLTRYRLTSLLFGQSEAQVEARVQQVVRSEQLTVYAVFLMLISLIAVALFASFPWSMFFPD